MPTPIPKRTESLDATLTPTEGTPIGGTESPVPLEPQAADTLIGVVTSSGSVVPAPVVTPGYEVLQRLGRGAAGVVYKAKQTRLQRTVALKMMVGYEHESQEQLARFRNEAVIVAQIQHPNVIQIYDIGEQLGVPYLATEYVDGGTLEAKLKADGRLPVAEAVRLVYQIARGVGAAHSRGVVHRDLKPANILITADGTPKVADFGLAKVLGAESNTITGSIVGTPAYMSPEQAAGHIRRIGPQTDVFALGVILYECLVGAVPHQGDSVMETLDKVRTQTPPSIRYRREGVPEQLEEIAFRCLRKVPTERYATADALADDLLRLATPTPKPAPPPPPATVNVYYILTGLALAGVVVLAVWLFGGPLSGGAAPTPTTTVTFDPQPTIRFETP